MEFGFDNLLSVEPQPKSKKSIKNKPRVNLGPELDLDFDKVEGLDTSVVDSNNIINIRGLCNRMIIIDNNNNTNEAPDSIYCRLLSKIENTNMDYDKVADSLDVIYHFFRPGNDNRTKFHGLINHILSDGGYMELNTIHLLADYLEKIETSRDPKTMEAIKQLKTVTSPIQTSEELESLLKKVKTTEYSEYEESFVGDHFNSSRTGLSLPYKDKGYETFTNLLQKHVVEKSKGIDRMGMVYTLFDNITKMTNLKSMIKADLECVKPIIDEQGHTIIGVGEFVEVKKLDLHGDSYLSEFFAVYKNSDIGEFANEVEYYDLYNQTIDLLFQLVRQSTWGQSVLDAVSNQFAGIIYKDNELDRFIPSSEIEIYWSNAGQPKCKNQRRLSIRYRVKSGSRSSYIYNHDGTMSHDTVSVEGLPKILCEPNQKDSHISYPKRIKEATVNDRQGKEWDRDSSQGKMIRTKGGTKELDDDFDWVSQHMDSIPDDPKIMALVQHLGASEVLGEDFNDDGGGWYGNHTVYNLQNGEEWVVGDETSMGNALYEYFSNYIDDMGVGELGIDLEDYIEVSDRWKDNYASNEADYYIEDLDDFDFIEQSDKEDEWDKLNERESELDSVIDELRQTAGGLQNRLDQMRSENEDYIQHGYTEPPHSEETMENAIEYTEEQITKLGHIENELEDIPYEREELVDTARELVRDGHYQMLLECLEDPVDCLVNERGMYSTATEAIENERWDVDEESIIEYYMSDGYGSMSGYDGSYYEENIGNETYILIRVN